MMKTHTVVTGIDDSTSVHTYNRYVAILPNESLNKNMYTRHPKRIR